MPALNHFREYCQWLRAEKPKHISKNTRDTINTAHARLRVAKHFRSAIIDEVSTTLNLGYSAGIRLLLCYSAAETMGDAVENHVTKWEITSREIVSPLRRIAQSLLAAPVGLKAKVTNQLQLFSDGESDNIRVVATALRHRMAHGYFAPAGKLSLATSGARAVERLSLALNDETERHFAEWFMKVKQSE